MSEKMLRTSLRTLNKIGKVAAIINIVVKLFNYFYK